MSSPREAPYGLWDSAIAANLLAEGVISFADVLVDSTTGECYHIEGRPSEKGRNVVVNSSSGSDVTPKEQNTRTGVHEYGGAPATVKHGRLIASDITTHAVFEIDVSTGRAKRVVPQNPALRFADFEMHPKNAELVVAVLEDHTVDEPAKVRNALVLINTAGQTCSTLSEGRDFYAAPRFNGDGSMLSWVEWDHPYMPWDGTELCVAKFPAVEGLLQKTQVAGSRDGTESISQPRWSLDGQTLLFLSDAAGYYNLYTWREGKGAKPCLAPAAKTDLGGPDWQFGQSTFQSLNAEQAIVRTKPTELSIVTLATGASRPLSMPLDAIYSCIRVASPQLVVCLASPMSKPSEIVAFDPTAAKISCKVLKTSSSSSISDDYISTPYEITYPAGPDPGQKEKTVAYAWFYPPKNPDFIPPPNAKPPVLIRIHGGPTSAASPALHWPWQYFTSRGIALADVNYGGSTGKGKAFRNRLNGNWGIVDINDSVACLSYLAEQGLVDPKKAIITGQSAGGYTTLQAVVMQPSAFAAAVSLYGVADLRALCEETHKFEAQYLFALVGGKYEDIPNVYEERSPINGAKKIRAPLYVQQGADDKVVPKEQAELIVKAVRENGVRCDYSLFAGEGHGWRQAETIIESAKKMLAFIIDVLDIREAAD